MVECFALNCLNFYNLRLKDRLVCLYNAILISRQMANARMEFYFLETTKKVAELMGERHVIFLDISLCIFRDLIAKNPLLQNHYHHQGCSGSTKNALNYERKSICV